MQKVTKKKPKSQKTVQKKASKLGGAKERRTPKIAPLLQNYKDVYLRKPDVCSRYIVFVSDDDVWKTTFSPQEILENPERIYDAVRITHTRARVYELKISPDETHVAYVCDDSGGRELWTVGEYGEESKRLTFWSDVRLIGWKDNRTVLFSSCKGEYGRSLVYEMTIDRLEVKPVETGDAHYYREVGQAAVLGRNLYDIAQWKGYKGGSAGQIWLRRTKRGKYSRILENIRSDVTQVFFDGNYIYFITDKDGCGNLYAYDLKSEKIHQLTHEEDFYVRSHGIAAGFVVYEKSGTLHLAKLSGTGTGLKLEKVCCPSLRVISTFEQTKPRYVDAYKNMGAYACNDDGSIICVITRGQLFYMQPWLGPVKRVVEDSVGRFRDVVSIGCEKEFVTVFTGDDGSDRIGKLTIEDCQSGNQKVTSKKTSKMRRPKRKTGERRYSLVPAASCPGKVDTLKVAPNGKFAVLSTHRMSLFLYDFKKATFQEISRSTAGFKGFDISPCSSYVVYARTENQLTSLMMYSVSKKENKRLVSPVRADFAPSFSTCGDYLYFIGLRSIRAVMSDHTNEPSLEDATLPYVIRLNPEAPSIFDLPLRRHEEDSDEEDEDATVDEDSDKKDKKENKVKISKFSKIRDNKNSIINNNKNAEAQVPQKLTRVRGPSLEDGQNQSSSGYQPSEQGASSPSVSSSVSSSASSQDSTAGRNTKKPVAKRRKSSPKSPSKSIQLEFSGMEARIEPFPLKTGGWTDVMVTEDRLFFERSYMSNEKVHDDDDASVNQLFSYELKTGQTELFIEEFEEGIITPDGESMLIVEDKDFRLFACDSKPTEGSEYSRKDGWIELSRMKPEIHPRREWEGLYAEAWALQKENFYNPNQKDVDFDEIFSRYKPKLSMVRTRSELSDLLRDMQGDLKTSHCYEFGGDYDIRPHAYHLASLGIRAGYEPDYSGYRVASVLKGESWDEKSRNPAESGQVSLGAGDLIVEVDGEGLEHGMALEKALENRGGDTVEIGVVRSQHATAKKAKASSEPELLTLRSIKSEKKLVYRDWVYGKKEMTRTLGKGRLGYIHVPAMTMEGLSEFYRHFQNATSYDGIVVDIRHNGGGFISGTILAALLNKQIAKAKSKWSDSWEPYPVRASSPHMVCLVNGQTGSDGDIFARAFQKSKLGPLIGTTTWGGVIGIWPQVQLIDGTVTTQPEYYFEFLNEKKHIENRGVEPDVWIENSPEDQVSQKDRQLEKAVEILLGMIG